jgi:ankyrin repeat protein
MGNTLSQVSIACGLATAEQIADEQKDSFLSLGTRPPASHDDFAPSLASLAIPMPPRFHLGARRGSSTHHELREALNLLTEVADAPDARSRTPEAIATRMKALGLLLRLGALDAVMMPRPIETAESFVVVVRDDTPGWLRDLLAEGEAFSREHADQAAEATLSRQLSSLEIAQVSIKQVREEMGDPALILAVLRGDMAGVRSLLAEGVDANALDHRDRSAMHAAAIMGDARMIRVLHEAGAAPDLRDSNERTPLELAIQANRPGALIALIRAGAALDTPGYKGMTPLALAVNLGLADCVNELLQAGANPNAAGPGGAPIHHAIFTGNPGLLKKLLQHNADPMRVSSWQPYVDYDLPEKLRHQEVSPVECAALTGQQRLFNILLGHGAEISALLKRNVPILSRAVIGGNLGIIDTCIKAGARLDEVDADGRTPIHWAAAKGKTDLFNQLIKRGANPLVADRDGCTVLRGTPRQVAMKSISASLARPSTGGAAKRIFSACP